MSGHTYRHSLGSQVRPQLYVCHGLPSQGGPSRLQRIQKHEMGLATKLAIRSAAGQQQCPISHKLFTFTGDCKAPWGLDLIRNHPTCRRDGQSSGSEKGAITNCCLPLCRYAKWSSGVVPMPPPPACFGRQLPMARALLPLRLGSSLLPGLAAAAAIRACRRARKGGCNFCAHRVCIMKAHAAL